MKKSFVLLIAATLLCGGLLYVFCPKPELVAFTTYSKAFFDRGGNLLRVALAEDDRYRIHESLGNISKDLVHATLLYEDQDYFNHGGLDFLALWRAVWTTYVTQERRLGASTITMQVARLRWNIKTNTIRGKAHQIIRALQLSRHYSKQQVLQHYFNLAPYGRNIEGAAAASLIYFNKKSNELSLPEALTLALIPQNPNKRVPSNEDGMDDLLVARESLLQRWMEYYPEDRNKLKYFDLPLSVRAPEQLPNKSSHFVNYLQAELPRWDAGFIDTTLDVFKQGKIEQIVANHISTHQNLGMKNASVLLLNYKTMEVEAMVGSADFYNDSIFGQVNGTLAKRSPGSTLKPFVYGLAIDEGLIHPMTLLKDSPRRFGGFTPENYDKQFLGPILAKDALIQSRNVPAVNLQANLSHPSFYDFITKAGISNLKSEDHYGLALALGGGEITMLELVNLYAMLANAGEQQDIHTVKERRGLNDASEKKRLLSAEASFIILDILKDNPAPDTINYDFSNSNSNEVAWKTGTSWAFRDAWAVGVSGSYVLAVWVGNFDSTGNDAFVGRTAAGPLLFSIFDAVQPQNNWTVAGQYNTELLNVKKVSMCRNTGDLPGKFCPITEQSWFIPGVSPIKVSGIYRSIPIDKNTGLRSCWHQPTKTEMKVFEFWPSDFLHIFQQAGISLKLPPAYSPSCTLDQRSASGLNPVITSPQATLEYVVRSSDPYANQIPLSVVVDPDVKKLFWFVDENYVGSSERSKSLLWQAVSGSYEVRVVDDSGRSASVALRVVQVD